MGDVFKVVWSKRVCKQIGRLPLQIERKFYAWVTAVNLVGIRELRKRSGFHDEPLKGKRKGHRSVRLSSSYRAIYVERAEGRLELIEIIEVTHHEY